VDEWTVQVTAADPKSSVELEEDTRARLTTSVFVNLTSAPGEYTATVYVTANSAGNAAAEGQKVFERHIAAALKDNSWPVVEVTACRADRSMTQAKQALDSLHSPNPLAN
jgi:hypothetical protein